MKHTSEEIIKALQVIQDECNTYNADCEECPFYTGDECKFTDYEEPKYWRLNQIDWKAFVNYKED